MKPTQAYLMVATLAVGCVVGFLAAALHVENAPVPQLGAAARLEASQPESAPEPEMELQPSQVGDQQGGHSATHLLEQATAKLEGARVYEQDDRTLEQKYAGATNAQLLAAWVLLRDRREREAERIGQLLIKADRLTLSAPGQTPDGPTTASVGGPLSFIHTIEGSADGAIVKGAHINGEEFPDYRALELEVWWLEQRTSTIRKSLR